MNREKVECEVEAILGNVPADVIDKVTTKILDKNINVDSKEFETVVKALAKNLTEGLKIKSLKLENDKFVADESQDDTIGEIREDGTVVKEYYGQGLIYKNFKNFEAKQGPCYIAEYQGEKGAGFHDNIVSDELKTKNFNDMIEGEDYETYDTIIKQVKDEYARRNLKASEQTIEDTAREIFYEVDWQNVSSLLDEWLDAEEEAQELDNMLGFDLKNEGKEFNNIEKEVRKIASEKGLDTSDKAINSIMQDIKDNFYNGTDIYGDGDINEDKIRNIIIPAMDTYYGIKVGDTLTDSTLEETNSLEENYSLVGIYTDEHGMEKRDIIKSFENKEDVDKYMEENEEELKAKNYDKMITEGFELDDEETKFINNMVAKTKTEIEDFLGYDLTEEQFDDKQGLRLAIKEIYEQMPNEELNKFEEVKSVNKLKENRQYTPVAKLETKQISNRARKLKESLYSAGDFGELLDTLDNMKQDAKVQRARNLTSHAFTHTPDEEEDERLGEIKDEVVEILTESKTLDESLKDYGVKPSPEFLQSVINKMVDNLGISKYEFKIEEDAIKFRYNGKVYFAEPVSMFQVDIFDDNHNKIGYGVGVNDIKEEVFTEYTDNDYLYELVGGEYAGTYTREEAEKLPIKEPELTDDLSDTRASGGFVHRKELDNQLQFKGYLGPMWNGTQDGKAVIRYETQEVYDVLSR